MPGEKPEESRNNDKCRVASADCTAWNSKHTRGGTQIAQSWTMDMAQSNPIYKYLAGLLIFV